ncbi:Uma2 family endonuclease [Anaerolineales bacterium HSG24]|nr:Uma2 family endonuclease [Anaerolineales bacterium HSG24]
MTVLTKPLSKDIPYMRSPSFLDNYEERDEFPHGWRRIEERGPQGKIGYRDVPLTPDDFFDPREGDQMPQGPKHFELANELYNKLVSHFDNHPDIVVLGDTKMLWRISGLEEPFPDISVIPNVKRKIVKSSFDCQEHGTRPCLIIEIMSPSYKGDDTKKVKIYQQTGVAEYIIINPHAKNQSKPYELIGYRLQRERYQRIKPNSQGQLLSQTTGLLVGLVGADKRNVELINQATGERLLNNKEEKEARLDVEKQLHQTVLNMLDEGLSTAMVSRLTGLSVTHVESLAIHNS